jgi:pimeloyl-ACP methyl ester carboxylesterase
MDRLSGLETRVEEGRSVARVVGPDEPQDEGMRRIALPTGVELAVREYGEGVPVLLLHAWGETHRTFDGLVPLLLDTMRLVVPDQRGAGDSAKPLSGYSLRDASADVVSLMDALEIEACWLIGTSSGGYLAQQVAVHHPSRVLGMVLIGSPSSLRRPLPVGMGELLASFHDPVTRADVEALNGVLPLHSPVPDSFLEDQLVAALGIPRHVWLAGIAGLLEAVPPIEQGSIRVRTLILTGAEEDVLPAGQAGELRAAIEESHLVVYEGTGHLVLWERPERVAEDMTAFITDEEWPRTSSAR